MEKNQIPLSKLAEPYFTICATEGKTVSALCDYKEKRGRFIRWAENLYLEDLSVELVREYISYLQVAPKYQGHSFHDAKGHHMSVANVWNHVKVCAPSPPG